MLQTDGTPLCDKTLNRILGPAPVLIAASRELKSTVPGTSSGRLDLRMLSAHFHAASRYMPVVVPTDLSDAS